MDTKTPKKVIKVDIYTSEKNTTYTGRLLGLVNDVEFNALINNKTLQKSVLTKGTIPLIDITGHYQNLEDYRLVVAIKSKGNTQFHPARLFISDKLGVVSYVKPDGSCSLTDRSQAYIMIEEKEVEHGESTK